MTMFPVDNINVLDGVKGKSFVKNNDKAQTMSCIWLT